MAKTIHQAEQDVLAAARAVSAAKTAYSKACEAQRAAGFYEYRGPSWFDEPNCTNAWKAAIMASRRASDALEAAADELTAADAANTIAKAG